MNTPKMPIVAFICNHNSCRSQIAEALGKLLAADTFVSYSAGTEIKNSINADAVRLIKQEYGVDMEASQRPKLLENIPSPDVAIFMGCNVSCPHLPATRSENWGLDDPTGKNDSEFLDIIKTIETNILQLKTTLQQ